MSPLKSLWQTLTCLLQWNLSTSGSLDRRRYNNFKYPLCSSEEQPWNSETPSIIFQAFPKFCNLVFSITFFNPHPSRCLILRLAEGCLKSLTSCSKWFHFSWQQFMLICMLFSKKYKCREIVNSVKRSASCFIYCASHLPPTAQEYRGESQLREICTVWHEFVGNRAVLVSEVWQDACREKKPWQDQYNSSIQGSNKVTIAGVIKHQRSKEQGLNTLLSLEIEGKRRTKSRNVSGQAL